MFSQLMSDGSDKHCIQLLASANYKSGGHIKVPPLPLGAVAKIDFY